MAWLAASGCADVPEVSGPSANVAAEPTLAPVVGGMTTDPCDWPSTVGVNGFGSCTGTLIHSRIVTTAAHCLSGSTATIYFGAGMSATGSFKLSAKCHAGAQGESGVNTNKDWAYCVLPEDDRVKQIPITPPLVGCEADKFLKPGASAWVVGFGTTSSWGVGAGVKRAVEVKVNSLDHPTGTVNVGDAMVGACHGDSGGPIYMHLADSTHDWGYRVFGSTSGAGDNNCDCSCSTVYINIENHVAAIEKNENIDVTPCTDAAGNWAPTADCKAFQRSPQEGTGTFPGCSVPLTSDPIETCGMSSLPAAGSGGASAGSGGHAGSAGAAGASAGSGGSAGRSATGGVGAGAGGMSGIGLGSAGAAGVAGWSGIGMPGFGAAAGSGVAGRVGSGAAGFGPTGTLTNAQTAAAGAPAVPFTQPQAGTLAYPPNRAPSSGGCQVATAGTTGPTLLAGWCFAALAFTTGTRLRRRRRPAHGA
jgi:hypothetical protein